MTTGYVEELALRYFQKKGYIVQPSVWFQMEKAKTGKAVAGWSDIDLVALKPEEIVACQCKSFLGTGKGEDVAKEILRWFEQAESFLHRDPMWRDWLQNRRLVKCLVVDVNVKKAQRILEQAGIEVRFYNDLLTELLGLLDPGKARKGKEDDVIIRLLVAMLDKGLVSLKRTR